MINLDLNNSPVETKFSFSTPKFSQTLLEKESHNKNNSLGFDLPSFEEPKFSTTKKSSHILIKKESKDINTNLNTFKENFSLSSILNEKNNDDKNTNDNDNSDKDKDKNKNENENKKFNLININIENPSKKKAKIKKALISFGDKSENENNSLCNNEIIYREKINNSSFISNKEKKIEESKGNQSNNDNNISLEKKDSENIQNINDSFQYSLPLENDKAPTASDFFIFDESNNNNISNVNGKEEKNEKIFEKKLDERQINTDRIENNKDKFETKENNKNNYNSNITYSRKKPKRSKTEGQSMTHKCLLNEEILEKIDEKILNSECKNKNKKKIKINSLLNSHGNSKKFRKKIKYDSINISLEKNKETNDDILLSENSKKNIMKNTPQKKLAIIKELKYFNLPKIKEDNFYQIKNYSSRENLQYNKNNYNLNNKIIAKGKNTLNKNIKSEINLNSYYSNQKKLKFTKFNNLFSDFQKFKKIKQNENLNPINTVRESANYNNIINSNIINNTNINNNYNNTIIGANASSKKFFIKKNTNKGILSNNNNKNIIIEPNNINKTRNFDNIISRNSNKIFNSALYNTINYVNTELKTITAINKNNNKKILNNKIKQIVQIKKSLPELQKGKKNINKINNNNNINNQHNYKFVKSKNNINNFENQNKSQINNNKNKININPKKTNNFVNNIFNNPKNHKRQKKFYNKFIYNVFETNPNINNKIQKENHIISNVQNNINNNKESIMNRFINQNSSTNSLQNGKYNKIKVHMIFNNHNKTGTSPNLFSEDKINNLWKIYKKPKNTCLVNQFSNDYNTIAGKKNYIKKKINILKSDLSDINSGNKSNKNSQIIHLRKRFINSSNLTGRNSISKFENKSNEAINKHQRSSMQELDINMEKIYSNIKSSPIIEGYNENIIRFSILRNNLNNKVINEFSITVGDKNNEDNENDMKNDIREKNKININNKKNLIRKEGTNNDKKTIINVNQYYPSYFINAHNQNFKEKK